MSRVSQLGSRRTRSRSCSLGSRASRFTSLSLSCAHHDIYSFDFLKSLSPGLRPRPCALRPCQSLREAPLATAGDVPSPGSGSALPLGLELHHGGPRPGVGDPGQAWGSLCDSSLTDVASPGRCKRSSLPASPSSRPASRARCLPTCLRCGTRENTGRVKLQGRAGESGALFTSACSGWSMWAPVRAAHAGGRPGACFLHILSQTFQTATEVEK